MATEAEIRSINRYNKANTVCVNIRLNKKTDADIINKLDNVPSKMGYIKDLIRKDINSTSETEDVSIANVLKILHDAGLDSQMANTVMAILLNSDPTTITKSTVHKYGVVAEHFLQCNIKIIVTEDTYMDFLNTVQHIMPYLKWIDGHNVTDWCPYGCFDYFYMWVESNKEGIPVLRADGFYEVEMEDFLDSSKYIWWQSL